MDKVELWVTVLDYAVGDIRMYHLADIPTDSEGYADIDIEQWLYDNDANYKEATCYYMCSPEKPEVEYKEATCYYMCSPEKPEVEYYG